jgi:RNA polymerase sigma factor (TIGR02999 family)
LLAGSVEMDGARNGTLPEGGGRNEWKKMAGRVATDYALSVMNDVSAILNAVEQGDPHAAEQLLPLVYDELRKLAAVKLAQEAPGQTLQATALVHEAYLRLVADPASESGASEPQWNSRGHFFAAAAEAMRRILVERARSKHRVKRGGAAQRRELDDFLVAEEDRVEEMLAIHDVLNELERHDAQAAALVKLRFFAGFEHQQAAEMLGLSRRSADRLWLLARTWLFRALSDEEK